MEYEAKDIIRFVPIFKERVWGSDDPNDFFGYMLPCKSTFGEVWDVVDRGDDQSIITVPAMERVTLCELLAQDGAQIMGPRWREGMRFPLLIKRLICKRTLSVQVHPRHDVAMHHGGEKKDEMWYVLHASSDAKIFVGLTQGVTREDFELALFSGELTRCLHSFKSQSGDAVIIPSGRVHAIGAGNVILEIQESSDTTYRVYDWDRMGLDGKPRTLHVQESLDSIDFSDHEPSKTHIIHDHGALATCDTFHVQQYRMMSPKDRLYFDSGTQPRLLHVVYGSVFINHRERVGYGESVLLPYSGSFTIAPCGIATVLVTDHFFL